MKYLTNIVIFMFVLSLVSGCASEENKQPLNSDATIYINANLVDVEQRKITTSNIEVQNGKIAGISTGAVLSSDAKVVDLEGQYVLPGLIDMHVHSWGNSSIQDNYHWIGPRGTLKAGLYAGVYGVLDLFSDEDDIFAYRNGQTNQSVEARLFAAGPCITATNGHCAEYGTDTRIIDSPAEAVEQVTELVAKRPNVIKVVYDHEDYGKEMMPTVDLETLKALIKTAKQYRIKTMVHIGNWQDVRDASEAGAEMLTHTPMSEMPADIPEVLKANGTVIVPTLMVQTALHELAQGKISFEHEMLKAVTTPELLQDFKVDINAEQFARFRAFVDHFKTAPKMMDEAVRRLAAAGVPVLVGTDAGNPLAFHGYGMHIEMQQLAEAGLPNWEILHGATIGAANQLGVDWGVKTGNLADFIVLEQSPVTDIRNTLSITKLVKSGQEVDRNKLQQSINPDFFEKTMMYLTGW